MVSSGGIGRVLGFTYASRKGLNSEGRFGRGAQSAKLMAVQRCAPRRAVKAVLSMLPFGGFWSGSIVCGAQKGEDKKDSCSLIVICTRWLLVESFAAGDVVFWPAKCGHAETGILAALD